MESSEEYLTKRKIKVTEIDGEIVYLKKSRLFGWSIVHPSKIDGKIVWENLIAGGNWWNLLKIALIIILIIGAISEFSQSTKLASACLRALPDYIRLEQYLQNPNLINNITGFIN